MSSIQRALIFGKSHVSTLLLSLLIFVFPIQLIHMFVSTYFYRYFEFFGAPFLGDLFNGVFILMALALAQIPFIAMVKQDKQKEEIRFGTVAGTFFQHMFPVYLFSMVYVLMVVLGSFLLLIPGLIAMILFFTYPYAMILSESKGWESLKLAYWVGKENFFRVAGILLAYGVIDWLLGMIGLLITVLLTQSILVVSLVQMGLNMLILPFFVIVLSNKFLEWTSYD